MKYWVYKMEIVFPFDKKPTEEQELDLLENVGELIDKHITENWVATGSVEERECQDN